MMKPILQDTPVPPAAVASLAASPTTRTSLTSEPNGVRQAKWLRPATAARSTPPAFPRPVRIDAALANVTTLLTPVPSRPSKNAQHDAATGWQPATPSGSPPRRLHNPQRDTAAGAYQSRQSPSSPVTLRRPRDPVAAVASQAPPRPPKPSPLTAGTCGDSSRMYAQIDYEALPTFRSTGITFVPYDKTVYATLHGPEPLISDAHGAPGEGAFLDRF